MSVNSVMTLQLRSLGRLAVVGVHKQFLNLCGTRNDRSILGGRAILERFAVL